ncbi:PIN domain-containing protein [Archaeoglobus sp.]|uniref:PIN domain-containing protein n=1 Tax=Archaeoglobus sp. TaxID=1872626 RepID=UPI0024AB0C8E|nr:PIN domain-containing protein [Archaeoglobus sp.]MDI3497836.1 uncharacterized protein [Archaeoglobus sp.]
MKAVIDTNVIVYDTFEDSVFHQEAMQLLDRIDVWVIPTIVIHEYVWVLKSLKVDVKEIKYKVEEYINHYKTKMVSENKQIVLSALERIVGGGLSLSRYNDELILAVAGREKLSLATFDERLRRQARARGVEVIP